MLYEYTPYTLEQELKNRIESQTRFTQEELYKLLRETVQGLAYLQSVGVQHQHLRPSTIYYTE